MDLRLAARLLDSTLPSDVDLLDREAALSGLATAQVILDALHADADSLDLASGITHSVAWHQARVLGTELHAVDKHNHGLPSHAVADLLQRHDVEPSQEQWQRVLDLDELPLPLRDALTVFLNTFLDLEDATNEAYADIDEESMQAHAAEADSARWLKEAGLDLGAVLEARNAFTDAATNLVRELAQPQSGPVPEPEPIDLCPSLALHLDQTGADDTYTTDCALIVDVNGDDTYHNNAGGGGGNWLVTLEGPCDGEQLSTAALVDVYGYDEYGSEASPRNCGVNGGAHGGTGFLLDRHGNDAYHGGERGANGGSIGGLGLLIDLAGFDEYLAGDKGVNGGGYLGGSGFLYDNAGSDTYTAGDGGANGGANTGSSGTLVDAVGRDWYKAGDGGVNGGAYLGASALLIDGTGNDQYHAQGAPANSLQDVNGEAEGGSAILVDTDGRDEFLAFSSPISSCRNPSQCTKTSAVGIRVDALGIERVCGTKEYYTTWPIGSTPVLDPCDPNFDGGEKDEDGNFLGDHWEAFWSSRAETYLLPHGDPDEDGLQNWDEFRWEHNPMCISTILITITNCEDLDWDGWADGAEVAYWNDPNNDALLNPTYLAIFDPDRTLDSDEDGRWNIHDWDSDDDDWSDGHEYHSRGTYPEFADSDCAPTATECSLSRDTSYHDPNRLGNPGTGDGLDDREEYWAWGSDWDVDFDGDEIPNNLLDPDSDNDGLLDGDEFRVGVDPSDEDTDDDGVLDGDEVLWSTDSDGDGRVNADDTDSDNDGMPDGWERRYGLNPVSSSDASMDHDNDGLTNLGEYQADTIPTDMDTEDDLLLDGEEVNEYGTDPHHWDTDRDGMPDEFETQYGLNPLSSSDANGDVDGDFFDQGNDGTVEQAWTNLQEYEYARPSGHNEAIDGPWQLGTSPRDADSDDDSAIDGQEVYFGTDPRVPAELESDDDEDGLNWTAEAALGTDPNDPDTDGDGLCDGGRGLACTFPGLPGVGHPGERDYGSTPWMTDSDADGIPDGMEAVIWDPSASGSDRDVDGDLVGGVVDGDNDGDKLQDGEEAGHGSRMDVPDSDGDGLVDGDEVYLYDTEPDMEDTDGDLLTDGVEVLQWHTDPADEDSDGDGLGDGAEALTHGTNALAPDSDADGMPDGWEVAEGTRPMVADAEVDGDGDGLNNFVEYQFNSSPLLTDTDGDTLPDGWEHRYDLDPRTASQNMDTDWDGSRNGDEFVAGTNPRDWDSDNDGLSDGKEAIHGSLPLRRDSDEDGLFDGDEVHNRGTDPMVRDTDQDGLSDYDEVFTTKTDPRLPDSDGDGLSDHEEVFMHQGKYDPNDDDTDNDGIDDGDEVALADPNGDFDNDGINNGDETGTYGTDPQEPDSDCDGIQDGAEAGYWSARYGLSTYKPYLLTADVDGDGIKDGIEVGTAGTERKALYRSAPDLVDTDGDGLDDDEEARNNVRVSCGQTQTRSSPLPDPVPGPSLHRALQDATGLVMGVLYEAPDGVVFGVDEEGVYIQGGYGVRLYPLDASVDLAGLLEPWTAPMAAGTNGKLTDPALFDTEGDSLGDGVEISQGLNPSLCDTDGDGLGDALELRVPGMTVNVNDPCTHFDSDPTTGTDPKVADSDGDSYFDGVEDKNANGKLDITLDDVGYCGKAGSESDPTDLDTDDDGISDVDEIQGALSAAKNPTKAFCFDSDGDGLSDGLELGVKSNQATADTDKFSTVNVHGYSVKTFQPSATGLVLNPGEYDFDGDGIPDGLEDLDADGRWGLPDGELHPQQADTDGDKIVDGRELLLWGLGSYEVPFEAVLKEWGGSTSGIFFDSSSFLETNPLVSNTDAGPEDSVPDGLDLNPRGDAFLAIEFGDFKLREKPDHNDWTAEIYVSELRIGLPFTEGGYTVKLSDASAVGVYSKGWNQFPEGTVTNVRNTEPDARPSSIAEDGFWTLQKLDGPVLKVNLPDSGASLNPADQTITIDLWLKEDDRFSFDNFIDLNPKSGAGEAHQEFRLGEILGDPGFASAGQLAMQPSFLEHSAKDDKASRDEDGYLKIRMGDTVDEFFLETVTSVLKSQSAGVPLTGTCFSQGSCP